jgi:hypothetical protein
MPEQAFALFNRMEPFGRARVVRLQCNQSNVWIFIMSSRMPPIPPANRSKKGRGSDPEMPKEKSVKHEHHANAEEEGETANIRQNRTNEGFFRGRRLG